MKHVHFILILMSKSIHMSKYDINVVGKILSQKKLEVSEQGILQGWGYIIDTVIKCGISSLQFLSHFRLYRTHESQYAKSPFSSCMETCTILFNAPQIFKNTTFHSCSLLPRVSIISQDDLLQAPSPKHLEKLSSQMTPVIQFSSISIHPSDS